MPDLPRDPAGIDGILEILYFIKKSINLQSSIVTRTMNFARTGV
jgi:hypothetical protein